MSNDFGHLYAKKIALFLLRLNLEMNSILISALRPCLIYRSSRISRLKILSSVSSYSYFKKSFSNDSKQGQSSGNVQDPTSISKNYGESQSNKSHIVAGMRKAYKGQQEVFDVSDLVAKEPYAQFLAWFQEAKETDGIMEANAMAIATATKDGKPSVRMVLMKGIDKEGVVFYTNHLSRKAKELAENPFASLLFYWSAPGQSRQDENPYCSLMFYWEPLNKMVRIEGSVERVSQEESEAYFHSRPKASQIGAVVSLQSQKVKDRKSLDDRNAELQDKYGGEGIEVPKPDYWGGYRVKPVKFEFWQGQTNRLHDRIVFRKPESDETIDPEFTKTGEEGWVYERLMP